MKRDLYTVLLEDMRHCDRLTGPGYFMSALYDYAILPMIDIETRYRPSDDGKGYIREVVDARDEWHTTHTFQNTFMDLINYANEVCKVVKEERDACKVVQEDFDARKVQCARGETRNMEDGALLQSCEE